MGGGWDCRIAGGPPAGMPERGKQAKMPMFSIISRTWDSAPRSFRLPMGGRTDWFYPDFIGELADGRLFAVEYKGALTGQTGDTVEKNAVGKLWAAQDPSRYVYATIYGDAPDGADVESQLDAAFA